MNSFLVDVNLPKNFSFFNYENFLFVTDINSKMSDSEIWDYAITNDLIIVTKDVDFYSKLLIAEVSPKIIYFKLGNYSLKQLHAYFNLNWVIIEKQICTSKFIIAKEDHIEIIY